MDFEALIINDLSTWFSILFLNLNGPLKKFKLRMHV
jgi:hypothetical protein